MISAVGDPRYVNIISLVRSKGMSLEDVDEHLEYLDLPVEKLIYENGAPIVFYYLDAWEDALWVHLGALSAILNALNIQFKPESGLILLRFAMEYVSKGASEESETAPVNRLRRRIRQLSKSLKTNDSSSVIYKVLSVEYMLATTELACL